MFSLVKLIGKRKVDYYNRCPIVVGHPEGFDIGLKHAHQKYAGVLKRILICLARLLKLHNDRST